MKWNKIILGVLAAGSLLALESCDKIEDFKDINSNPNATTEPITSALLTNVLAGQAVNVFGGYPASLTVNGAFYCQYFTESQYTETSRYQTPTINWDGAFAGRLNDLQNIINYNTTSPAKAYTYGDNANQIAIARILKAFNFWMLTDCYGDIPYFDALKGNGLIKYDAQSDIYPDLIKELKEAAAQFVAPTVVFKGDIMFGGDVSKWKKFANSLRLLIALQASKKSSLGTSTPQAEFLAALNDGVITSNSENPMISYPGGVFNNPVYAFYNIQQRSDLAVAKTITDILVANNDGRSAAYGTSTVGIPYGLDRAAVTAFTNANTNWAKVLSTASGSATSPVVLIGAANVYLARAEAANLGWGTENAAAMYSLGIQRSWEQWGVYNAGAFASYMAQTSVDLSAGNAASKIGLQSWLAWYPNGWRGWSHWRKTGFPALTPAPQTPVIPILRRFPYGPTEAQLNPSNYVTAAGRYTVSGVINSQDAKVWWDQ